MFRKSILAPLLIIVSFGLSSTVHAVVLTGTPPGFTDFALPGTTVLDKPELAGLVLEDLLTPFSITGAGEGLSGMIQNRVVRSDIDNTLTFYWRILPSSGAGDISAFRLTGFDGFTLDADWRPDGLGDVAPDIARYFGDGTGSVNFLFEGEEVGGTDASGFTESYFFYLDTAALNYDMTGSFDLLCAPLDCISESYSTFAPSAVPIPAAAWLFGTALFGLLGFSKRRKSA